MLLKKCVLLWIISVFLAGNVSVNHSHIFECVILVTEIIIYSCLIISDTVKVKPEPKKEKDTKPQSRSQSKASTKKTSNRRSPSKKEKNGLSVADICPREPVESQVVAPCSKEAGGSEEPELASSCSPAHKLFHRTLSPADVLHVHSYAKGDYGEGDALPKEEKKTDSSDNEMEKVSRHVSKAVSRYKCSTHSAPKSMFLN